MNPIRIAALVLMATALAASGAMAQDAAPGHSKLEFLQTYDADLDGVVTQQEYMARRGEAFARTDADQNGVLDVNEYVSEYTARLDAQLAEQRARQIRQAHVRFGVMDADHDSQMSRAEYEATASRTFQRLDTNGDGKVDDQDTADNH
ncbi:MAG: hypothetical protein Q7V15_05685 [Phenylobacterium sp.]|uniref:hypothetical protein n=1 Tax=Phenylobacterium sp. TaxID=1871053 RepID=UPI00272268A4|nr:hypothetical protein [Phenylobacterium sp.]MDO8900830.1 hypothetical protein [Phenylobacterium sp.]